MKMPIKSLSVAALLLAAAPAIAAPKCETVAQISPSNGQTVPETNNGAATQVQLNGAPSKDATTFSWKQLSPGAYPVTLSDPSAAKPTFAAPAVGPAGATLSFMLTVTGCSGTSTAVTTVIVTNVNSPPVASASVVPAEVFEGTPVSLDGSASTDPENDRLTYLWEQTGGPGVPLTISSSNAAVATFMAPTVPYPNGASLSFKLTVSDGTLANSTSKTVTVKWLNDPPVAVVDCPKEVEEGGPVSLTSRSTDSDDGIASYKWAQLQGLPNAQLPVYDPLLDHLISFTAPLLYSPYDTMKFELTVTDKGGLFSSTECDIKVRDITAPVITGLEDITLEASSAAGATGTFSPAATDNVDGAVEVTCDNPSGSTFPLGKTTVVCSAADKAENPAKAQFLLTVRDTTPPAVTPPADVTVEATGPLTKVAFGTASATDAVGVVYMGNDAPAAFGLGSTKVTWTARDAAENAGTAMQTVTVRDTTPPAVTPPADVTVEATGPLTKVAFGTASATDAVGVVYMGNDAPAAFGLGSTKVTWTARDAAENAGTAMQTVTVRDTTPPAVTPPADVTVEATGPLTKVAFGTAAATDAVGVVSTVSDAPASFGVGSTRVTWTAKDAAGNAATAVQTITVRDTTSPTISGLPAGVKTQATSAAGAVVNFTLPSATDLVDGPVKVACSAAPGSTFAVGKTQVTCSAVDAHGNVAASAFDVAVVYNWTGFYSPVESNEVNKVKAGSAIPIKFSLGGNMGLDLFSRGYPISVTATSFEGAISVNDLTDLGILPAGGSGLSYDPVANQYVYVWKTDKAWAGTSRQLQVRLKDGMVYIANFSFVK